MRLVIHVPSGIAVDETAGKVVAEAPNGSFCLLPRHVDCATALVPGILAFVDGGGVERFVAVDRAILVKRGTNVFVSALRAVRGGDLLELEATVRDVYERLEDSTLLARSALAQLEAGFQRRLFDATEALRE